MERRPETANRESNRRVILISWIEDACTWYTPVYCSPGCKPRSKRPGTFRRQSRGAPVGTRPGAGAGLVPGVVPAGPRAHLDVEGNAQVGRTGHLLGHQLFHCLPFAVGHLKDQFVVDLQQHA
jgi:hypothetical protein